tara:strand:+ start:12021 stop:14066 length:2046 start_codon:yes stop_codon:yes gene_type:complete
MITTAGSIAGVDVGGTFTDLVLFDPDNGTLHITKVPSTPTDQSQGVVSGLARVLPDLTKLTRLDHGTTVSTNALLEGTGATVAMITTDGFRDVLEIGRTRRMLPSVYDPTFVRPAPLVPRPLRFEISERIDKDGSILIPLDSTAIKKLAPLLDQHGIEAVAVCFLHSYAHPSHEQSAVDILRHSAANIAITASHEVVPEFREYERFSTTVINAYLLPVMTRYLSTLGDSLAAKEYRGPVYTMASNGGTMDLETAQQLPIRTILSGPVGGVTGALWITADAAVTDFVTCDMGGTSTDVCLIENGQPAAINETAFVGYPIKGRQVDINTVGAGGGSIAYAENGDTLRVGPRSAGAKPGPACYDHGGTDATVTDANMVLGRVGNRRLGGSIQPKQELAQTAVSTLATELSVPDVFRMANGIVRVAVAQMASAIREITIERGHDPTEFTLVAFGGAGPMHATLLADEIGMREVFIPVFPGNLSALGLLASDQIHESVVTFLGRLNSLDLAALLSTRDAQVTEGRRELIRRGFTNDTIRFTHSIDMRYSRQAFEITVEMATESWSLASLRRAFLDTYERHYGHADSNGEIEVVNLRTSIIGVNKKPMVPRAHERRGSIEDAIIGSRESWFDESLIVVNIYDREKLPVNQRFSGPAIVEEDGSTTVVTPGWTGHIDSAGNLRLTAVH